MEYVLTDFCGVAEGHFRKFRRQFRKYSKAGGFLRNVLTQFELRIEGDAGGLQGFGLDFLLSAAQRSHLHLYSGRAPGHFVAPFTEGLNAPSETSTIRGLLTEPWESWSSDMWQAPSCRPVSAPSVRDP